jgi:hypothetical protein
VCCSSWYLTAAAAPPRTLSRQFSPQKPPACHLFFRRDEVANERNVKGQWITRQIVSFTSFTPPPPPISISDTLFSTSCLFLFSFRPVSSKPAVSLYTSQFLSSFFISGCVLCTPKGEKNRKDSRNESTFLRVRFFFGFLPPAHLERQARFTDRFASSFLSVNLDFSILNFSYSGL